MKQFSPLRKKERTEEPISPGGGYTEFFSWGSDSCGQLGHGFERGNKPRKLSLPKSLSFEVKIKDLSCGFNFASFLTHLGHIFTFGDNADGQLGINDRNIQFSNSPLLVSSLSKMEQLIDSICCGGFHMAAKTSTGEVFFWGRNFEGQCGTNMDEKRVIVPTQIYKSKLRVEAFDLGDLHTALIST